MCVTTTIVSNYQNSWCKFIIAKTHKQNWRSCCGKWIHVLSCTAHLVKHTFKQLIQKSNSGMYKCVLAIYRN